MATAVVQPTGLPAASSASSTTTGTTLAPTSLSIKDIIKPASAQGEPAPDSPDDGFYSAAMFDSAGEAAFIQAQRDAFAAISDAALARAIQESELLAARKAAEENRRKAAAGAATAPVSASAGVSTSSSSGRIFAPSPAIAAPTPSRYAFVNPSELGQPAMYRPSSSASNARRASTSTPAPGASSSSPPRSHQPSSLSSSTTPPTHRPRAPSTTHRPAPADRQPSSRAYTQTVPTSQPPPKPITTSHSKNPSAPTAAPAPQRQTTPAPQTSRTNSTYPYSASSSAKPPTGTPTTTATSTSGPAPPPMGRSRAVSQAPAPSSWQASAARPSAPPVASSPPKSTPTSTSQPAQSASKPAEPPSQPPSSAAKPIPIPVASARDLRMGVLAGPRSVENRPAVRPSSSVPTAPQRPRPTPAPRMPVRQAGRRRLSESEVKLARAKAFLVASYDKECLECEDDLERPEDSPSIPSEPFAPNLLKFLHVSCSDAECGATYCRGCFAPVGGRCLPADASSSCRGQRGCSIKTCCSYAPVIAISSILTALDAECIRTATSAGFPSIAHDVRTAECFVHAVIARSDTRNTRSFEGALIKALHAISGWLYELGHRMEDEEDEGIERQVDPVKDLLQPLVRHSLLPALLQAFLQNRNVGDWLKHSEIYVLILEVLRRMVDRGLGKVFGEPVVGLTVAKELEAPRSQWRSPPAGGVSGEESSTSESSGGEDFDDDSSEGDTETDNTSPGESEEDDSEDDEDKRKTWTAPAQMPATEGSALSIKSLIAKLEDHRVPLMAVGANITFPATKMKVQTLCDGISYLLLQQVMQMD